MRSVLVTDASTPVGERLVRELLDDPAIEHVLAVGPRPQEVALPFDRPGKLHYLQADLGRARHVRTLLFGPARDLAVDSVLHSALVEDPREAGRRVHALNVESTRELLHLSEGHPTIRRFVLRSFSEVYRIRADLPVLIEEDHPLNIGGNAPQWIQDRVEADVTVCTRMGLSPLQIAVVRTAECLAPGTGSQLFDYLESPICFRPAGFDPMVNVITIADLVRALRLTLASDAQGVFNVPGLDTLPLSSAVLKWGRPAIPVPGGWLHPLYRWRERVGGHAFRYGPNRLRFHYSGVLDGTRARRVLGYEPAVGVDWPLPVREAAGLRPGSHHEDDGEG
ncbi:MAG: hypothetical protein JXB39_06580 [Deltaproteobacteria bacterium]|nr:hypothetical protein [Deltaproteobacteria bacterium]